MKKTCKIVMMETDEKSMLGICTIDLELCIFPQPHKDEIHENQHLYVLSDDEINAGDWFMNTGSGGHPRVDIYQAGIENTKTIREYGPYPEIKKIIASTNPKVVIGNANVSGISMDIIKAYVKYYNKKPDFEVEVKYTKEVPAIKDGNLDINL